MTADFTPLVGMSMKARFRRASSRSPATAKWSRVSAACNVAVEVPVTTPFGLNVLAPTYNAWLRRHATVTVPWASIAAHPDYVIPDGVHQTEKGMAAFRAAIVAGVRPGP